MAKTLTLSLFGVTIPIPRWSIGGFGVLALVGVAGIIYRQIFPPDLINLQQANHALSLEVQEYGRHLGDTPQTVYASELLTLRVYDDRCLLITTKKAGTSEVLTKLVPDLTRADWPHNGPDTHISELWSTAVYAQGRCLSPHPGQFQTSYGKRNGCWVEVWRRWPDGCEHMQQLNTCSGAWETNADGTPKVTWTKCVH